MKKTTVLLSVLLYLSITQAEIQVIPADTLTNWLQNSTTIDYLIDVREPEEIDSVIATANCRPYNLPWNTHVLDSNIPKLPKNSTIVLYCARGSRSFSAAQFLNTNGFTTVYSLSQGFSNWTSAKMAVSYLKPISDLPAFSMEKTAVSRTPGIVSNNNDWKVSVKNGALYLNEPITSDHSLMIFNLHGKCILKKQNPFHEHREMELPGNMRRTTYVATITTALIKRTFILKTAGD